MGFINLPRQDLGVQPNATTAPQDYCIQKALGLTAGQPIPNLAAEAAAIIWVFFGLSTVFLGLRVYCKIWRGRGLWWDDHILIASWLAFLGDAVMSQRAFDYGFGKYPCDINPLNIPKILFQGSGLGASFGIFAIVWSKTSFAFTILRISKETKIRYFVIALTIIMNIAMTLQFIFVWARCDPVEKLWKFGMAEGKCWDSRVTNYYGVFAGSLSGVADIILALLPWTLLRGLQMKKKEKIGVIVAMSMGVFVGIVSFVKSSMILTRGGPYFTYHGTALLTWAGIEIGVTVMACCIPVLRVLFRDLHDATKKSGQTSGSFKLSQWSAGTTAKTKTRGTVGNTTGSTTIASSRWDFDRITLPDRSGDDDTKHLKGSAD
ncbi:hypothetical protein QBC38DRAFT_486921 [Podospora fimiseda]|uniref:Rhodopsin domain-containing protein n=1 Tax=Podospora fimiseda TaxID=252190 RepID=A0AAN7GSW5_9PEZI|nr:hypothetical protein QBC38DRAFT_486921 [Podospora fimiseda]